MIRTNSECKPEKMKLVSVSPFRAVLKMEESEDDIKCQDDSDIPELDLSRNNRRESPIKHNSEYLRGQRDHYLRTYNG